MTAAILTTLEKLEQLSFAEHLPIEVDSTRGRAYLQLPNALYVALVPLTEEP